MSRPATTRLKVNQPLGSPPTLEWRPCAELQIDPVYQRSIQAGKSQALIRRIAQFWDWGLCQPLAVARRADGTLMVVDGQHRLEAARLRRDVAHLPCVITSYANAGDEAAAFVALNQQRRPLTKLDLFKAAVAAEDEAALAITRLLADAGMQLAPHTNYTFWKPGMAANVHSIQECYRIHGEKVTAAALEALERGFQGQVLRYAATIFPGIYGFIADQKRAGNTVSRSRLAEAVGSFTQAQWKTRIIEEQGRLDCRRAIAARAVMAGLYATSGPVPVAANAPAPVILDAGEIGWCVQCDQKVSAARAANCTDRFCSMRKAKAA